MQDLCPNCEKRSTRCVCSEIDPVSTRTQVVILQHPQEPKEPLSTAKIAHLVLKDSNLRIGLSWRNLEHALGAKTNPKDWAVLYLGSAKVSKDSPPLVLVSKKGLPLPDQSGLKKIRGLIVLDGTWSQAKTLWWRNAWLLKVQRLVLFPSEPSLYGTLRREPRRESLSTLEAIGLSLEVLEKNSRPKEALLKPFLALLKQKR